MNGAYLDPTTHTLIISASIDCVALHEEEPGRVVITVEGLDEGIDIVEDGDRLWRPVRNA